MFVKNKFKVTFFTKLKCNFLGGYLADQYVLYDLEHYQTRDFLSEFDWYRSRYINDPFSFAFNNKIICSEILKQYIKTPYNYYLKNKGALVNFKNGDLADEEDLLNCLKLEKSLFLKPIALGKGEGVHLLEYIDKQIYVDGNNVSKDKFYEFLKGKQDFFVCEYIVQHTYASTLYPKTTNTIRLVTIRDIKTNRFKVIYAVQRIGRHSTVPVDNGSKGALISKIDLNSGRLSAARCLTDLKEYAFHPDIKSQIKDIEIPHWEMIKNQTVKLCNKFPYMNIIAWDVVLTNNGVCVIEANSSTGVNILQLWGGQRNEELGAFFQYHGVIK